MPDLAIDRIIQRPALGGEQPTGSAGYRLECQARSEEHTSELQSRFDLVCRLPLEKKHEQPALFQRRFRFARVPQPTHHQGFGFAALPAEATDRVATETAQRTYALVAVDHDTKIFI